MSKGIFITFEGGEGSGKSTQIDLLHEHLKKEGHDVFVTREPGGLEISEEIREVILKPREDGSPKMNHYTELLLFLAARAHFYEHVIIPNLLAGKIVLCDRSYDSTKAYQGYARGMDLDLIDQLNDKVTAGTVPDITFYLDIDPVEGLKRVRESRGHKVDRLDAEALEFHHKVREGYKKIAEDNKNRFVIVDAQSDIDSIHGEIKDNLVKVL